MVWYYLKGQQRQGPIGDETFSNKVADGEIRGETLVWQPGMSDWTALQQLGDDQLYSSEGGVSIEFPCVECGRPQPHAEMVQLKGQWVCAACKPKFLMRLRESTLRLPGVRYARFWRRGVAKMLDYGLLGLYANAVGMLITLLLQDSGFDGVGAAEIVASVVVIIFSFILQVAYHTWFIGKYSATLGKMAMGIKVIMPDGGKVSYLRAFVRYLMENVSSFIFYFGYLLALYDERYRTLHDMVCDTRVVLDVKENAEIPEVQKATPIPAAGEIA